MTSVNSYLSRSTRTQVKWRDSGTKRWEEEEEDKHNEPRIFPPKCLMTQRSKKGHRLKRRKKTKGKNKTKPN